MFVESWKAKVSRKKVVDEGEETGLHKCLHTNDLVFMGITALGVSIYVVGGQVVHHAGPAALASYILASIAAAFSALCYAEFGSRIPKAGSAYVYTYVCMGELWGFIIGWCILVEYVVGVASVASSASLHINLWCKNSIATFLQQHLPINSFPFFNKYPDLIAFSLLVISTVFLCIGIKTSSFINKFIAIFNLLSSLVFIIYASMFINFHNWSIPKDSVPEPEKNGEGGLLPHKVSGVIAGAGIAFYSFVGFDVITIEGEESLNPRKSIPTALLVIILFTLIEGSVMASLLTLIVPYYDVQVETPFYQIFVTLGKVGFSRFVVVSIITTLLAGMYPGFVGATRILYAMASDGLLMKCLSRLSRFKTPVYSNLVVGFIACMLATFVHLEYLVGLLSSGSLITYTFVCYCVLKLRYQKKVENPQNETENQLELLEDKKNTSETKTYGSNDNRESKAENECLEKIKKKRKFTFNDLFYPPTSHPTEESEKIFRKCMVGIVVVSSSTAFITSYFDQYFLLWDYVAIGLVSKSMVIYLIYIIWNQPSTTPQNSFSVPLMPFLPIIGIIINIYFMMYLPGTKWLGIAVWLLLGFLVYFSYGIRNSDMNLEYKSQKKEDTEK